MPRTRKQSKSTQLRDGEVLDPWKALENYENRRIWSSKCPHTSTWNLKRWATLIPVLQSVTLIPNHERGGTLVSSDGNDRTCNPMKESYRQKFVCADCGLEAGTPKSLEEEHKRKKSPQGHSICFDRNRKEMYCLKCDDYVYMEEFEAIMFATEKVRNKMPVLVSEGTNGATEEFLQCNKKSESSGGQYNDSECRGGTKEDGNSPNEIINFVNVISEDAFPVGLRGMNNMGNTCFMNSILQAFLRTPLLPKYYLNCNHFEGNCRVSAEGGHCVECQLDIVISDIFSGGRTAYSPVKFLHTWWMMAGGFLSGYKQQDAHEFFLFILQMLTGHPNDIATSLYIGQMQSHIFCPECGRNSIQRDEFSHLSLDVLPPSHLLPPAIASRAKGKPVGKNSKGKRGSKSKQKQSSISNEIEVSQTSLSQSMQTTVAMGKEEEQDTLSSPGRKDLSEPTIDGTKRKAAKWNHPALSGYLRWPGDSLLGCLRRFTRPEILGKASHDWKCPECNMSSHATKQISIVKLPAVLTMHFKRFEYTGGIQSRPRKIETFVSFPLDDLDMSHFLTCRISLQRQGIRVCGRSSKEFLYDAFAVVCHRGTFQGGHYVSYVRCQNNRWYLCDDAFVTEVPEDVVRNSQAYMVFYSRKAIAPWNT